jgi:hypothetical protein
MVMLLICHIYRKGFLLEYLFYFSKIGLWYRHAVCAPVLFIYHFSIAWTSIYETWYVWLQPISAVYLINLSNPLPPPLAWVCVCIPESLLGNGGFVCSLYYYTQQIV